TGPDSAVEFSVAAIAGAMTITPDDADGFVVAVQVPGLRAQYTAAVEATQTAIDQGLRGNHTAPIGYVLTEPALTTDKAQALGIKEVIGEFTTGGFAAASGANISVVG